MYKIHAVLRFWSGFITVVLNWLRIEHDAIAITFSYVNVLISHMKLK